MYSKQEAANLKREFWTVFGQYMRPVLSAEGEPVNWVNYKTGEKNIFFRTSADNKSAAIAIELHHPDKPLRDLYFEQFGQLKKLLESSTGEAWEWEADSVDEYGKSIARIYTQKTAVSVFKREDWPALISFFKQNLLALDEFWSGARHTFEALR